MREAVGIPYISETFYDKRDRVHIIYLINLYYS